MTLTIDVEFLHRTFRADPDGLAHTGRMTIGEWPPSPARLFAALIAADGTGERCRVTDGSELEYLEQLGPPVIHADPSPTHQALQPRYVVRQDRSFAVNPKTREVSTQQEYIGRTAALVRPGVRVCPRTPRVCYVYEVEVSQGILAGLQRRAARVGYLGTADSPVRLRVLTNPPNGLGLDGEFVPDPDGDLPISVPRPGHLRIWDSFYEDWCERGAAVGRSQYRALRYQVLYRSPGATTDGTDRGSVVAWLRLESSVSGRRVAAVSSLFKQSVLAQYQRIHGEPPAVLHGHAEAPRGYDLARYLALPDVGFPRSRGTIHGLALWLPPECDPDVMQRSRDAARSVRRLVGESLNVGVRPWDGERRPVASKPERWTQKSDRWVTAFPAIHERHGPLTLAEVARWCRHAELPEPVAFRSGRHPLVHGGVDLAPREVHRPNRPGKPYSHIELLFAEPIRGPVVIGAGRQRGFGFCVPVVERSPVRGKDPADA